MYTHANLGWDLLFVGEVDRAIEDFADAYQIQPDFDVNLIGYSLALIFKEKYPEADLLLRRAERLSHGAPGGYLKFIRALYLAALGEKEKALASSRWPGVLATLRMKEQAIAAIADGIEHKRNGYGFLTYLPPRHLPIYDGLRDEPKFQKILEQQREDYMRKLDKYSLAEIN